MTKRTSNKWLPALIVAPVAAGIFGASTSWAATHDPMATESMSAPTQSEGAKLEETGAFAGVPESTKTALTENQTKIDALNAQLQDVQAQIASVNEQLAGVAKGSSNSGSSYVAPNTSAPAPAPTTAPAPTQAPPTNTSSGAS